MATAPDNPLPHDVLPGDGRVEELAHLIRAYRDVTDRLRQTHETLLLEVQRLREQLQPGSTPDLGAEGKTLEEMEREVIVRALCRHKGHRRRTAQALGIGVRTLGLKLRKWKDQNLVATTL